MFYVLGKVFFFSRKRIVLFTYCDLSLKVFKCYFKSVIVNGDAWETLRVLPSWKRNAWMPSVQSQVIILKPATASSIQ